MQKIGDVLLEISKINMQRDSKVKSTRPTFELTDEICNNNEIHPLKKNVKMMVLNGEKICPLCEKHKQDMHLQRSIEKNIEQTRINRNKNLLSDLSILSDETLKAASFESFIANDPATEIYVNKQQMIKVYKAYRKGEVFNTWLFGRPGAGKSHLAMALMNNLSAKGNGEISCLFVKVDKLMASIRDTFKNGYSGNDSEASIIQRLIDTDYLVLDDLGAESGSMSRNEQASDFIHRVLYAVCDGRQHKSTVITTNLISSELKKIYDDKLLSRLLATNLKIEFTKSQDARIKNKIL
ncbi:AAA family ATPase [Listeria monocytogenes]|nr:AAA family ATPase [Listeria monocytogenes]EDN9536223.1 AAA family ATPase [Listeria monocytogenes]